MTKFNVPAMKCGHCTAAIQKSVTEADPTALLEFDIPGRMVEIDSADDAATLLAAIKEAGFEATAA
ncbi:copper chaperone [Thalassobius vesicularis]|uniref:Copper chaperone n=1 Tax=Thalassobius vesicularis TaxID=1294297 RepID=A0A4S3M7P9_9RHOB|nr:heavy-metal-associated domain-containing protein [Thalassobius vesicularis]THD72857.1 copper chaperone [Thalassobius vesicularis]